MPLIARLLDRFRLSGVLAVLLSLLPVLPLPAQNATITYSTIDPGVSKAITNWGLDTCWPSLDNMKRGLIFMGTNNVNIVRVGFFVDAPLTNNDVTPADKSSMQTCINIASLATAATRWDLNLDSTVDASYITGANTVNPALWATAMEACQHYYNRPFWAAEGFNEPDYTPNNEGSTLNLLSIFANLQSSTNFTGTLMEGGSTLNDDVSLTWFNTVAPRASMGSTHCLAGSAASYSNFLQSVTASNAMPFNPELHNVMEAIMGVQDGLKGGIWWGTAELARGDFVQACQGMRLGYADNLNNWTAAAVYRGTNGAVQAFLGGSERMATTTTYRFFATDRNVFYDGYGPRRDYTVVVPGGTGYQINQPDAEKVVSITWGADVQPPIAGRYVVVNCNSHLVLEVPGASTNNGVILDQNNYTGALNQQWDINPLTNTFGGDYSYFPIKAAHDGVTMDETGFSYNDGTAIEQWNGGTNAVEQWYFQYTSNNCFKIRSRWCNKAIGPSGASISAGAQIVQGEDNGTPDQQWRLIPVGNVIPLGRLAFTTPAAPAGLSASANAASVTLNWNANSGTGAPFTYTVLRGTNTGGPYEIIARGLTNNTFTDGGANQARSYYYVVEAVDQLLDTSPTSSEVNSAPTLAATMLVNYDFERNALDGSLNANNGEFFGTPLFVPGKYGAALSLNGNDQYAMAPAGIMASATNFTIAVWVKWNGGAQWQRIFDFGDSTTNYMFLTPDSGSGTLRFAITTNGGGAEQVVETSELPSNQWIHVAVTFNGATATIYTNAVQAASGGVTLSPALFNPVLNNFGASQFPADPYFTGMLDSIYIFNYALSRPQILALMNGVAPNAPSAPTGLSATPGNGAVTLTWVQSVTPGIVSNNIYRSTTGSGGPFYPIASVPTATNYYDPTVGVGLTYYYCVSAVNVSAESPLSGFASTVVTVPGPLATLTHRYHYTNGSTHDIVGTANGVLVGTASITGGQLVIPNPTATAPATNYLQLPAGILHGASGNIYPAVTVEAWATINPSQYTWANLFDFGNRDSGGAAEYDIHVCVHSGDNATIAGISDSDNANVDYQFLDLGSGSRMDGSTNVHITAVFNPPGGYLALYLNGTLAGMLQNVTIPMSGVQDVRNIVGADNWADPGMQGSISELRIYDGALQPNEIAATQALGPNQLLSSASPTLQASLTGTNLVFTWPLISASYSLQESTDLASGIWTNVSAVSLTNGSQLQITVPASGLAGYFRLEQ